MAEIAVPIILLGSLYIMSQQEKNKENFIEEVSEKQKEEIFKNGHRKKEGFSNIDHSIKVNDINEHVPNNSVNAFNSSNQHTDKFFITPQQVQQQSQQSQAPQFQQQLQQPQQMNLMSGQQVDINTFKHNNMQPFFGSKIKGATSDYNNTESLLDSKQGNGSQLFSKSELAPLFKPEDNYNYQYGTPHNTDFMQSRMNESMKMNNVTLWEPQRVAPGLNLGYGTQNERGVNTGGTEGLGGFNAGVTSRESWMPRNVDDLRVANNPKQTFDLNGHQGPANSAFKYSGPNDKIGKIEKHLPEKYYQSGPDRWFTTTGAEKNPPIRSTQVMPMENRIDTTREYYGASSTATHGQASYVDQNYEDSKKQNLGQLPFSNATATGQAFAADTDYGLKGYNILPNNRNTDAGDNHFGAVFAAAKGFVTPILDIINPTRKENIIGNLRQSGNVNGGNKTGHIFNDSDKTKVTNREMTTGKIGLNHLNVQRQNNDGYMVASQTPIHNQRDTTSTYYNGVGSAQGYGIRPYNNAYAQHNNVNKTYESRPNQGNMSLFNNHTNMDINRDESLIQNNRGTIPNGNPSVIPSTSFMGDLNGMQQYDMNYNANRLDPGLLEGFRKNPYTQSLTSVA